MKCPNCGCAKDRVIDSRPSDDETTIRRRRECQSCHLRFTTYERLEFLPLMVIKRDFHREPFNRQKIVNGLLKACEKRPITSDQLNKLVDDVEYDLHRHHSKEVQSNIIGKRVMSYLMKLDQVAYVRFASVYQEFKDVQSFVDAISDMLKRYDQ